MKTLLITLALIFTLTFNCNGASNEGINTPSDVQVTILTNPLDPIHDIAYYIVGFFPDTLEQATQMITQDGTLEITFRAPTRYTTITQPDTTEIPVFIIPVPNDSVTYAGSQGIITINSLTPLALPMFYEIRLSAVGTNEIASPWSDKGYNYIEVRF